MKKQIKTVLSIFLVASMAVTLAPQSLLQTFGVKTKADAETIQIPSGALIFNEHSYYVYKAGTVSTWEGAINYCKALGGHLATISSQEENNAIYNYISEQGITSAYFGLSDRITEGVWKWENSEDVSYTNWHSGEPSAGTNEDYAMFYYGYTNGQWNDGSFGAGYTANDTAFICEWDSCDKTDIAMEASYETTVDEDLSIYADLTSETFVPTSTNMSWSVKYNSGDQGNIDDISIGKVSVTKSGTGKYIISTVFTFKKSGNYELTLKSDDGASETTVVKVKSNAKLIITKPEEKYSYADKLASTKTFSMVLKNAEETPTADDFECSISRKNAFTDSEGSSVDSEDVKVKNITKESDGSYSLEFDYTANDTGLFDFTIKYKDEQEDDVELMVYDSTILEQLEEDFDGTIDKYYEAYIKKVSNEVKKIYNDQEADPVNYKDLADQLKTNTDITINGNAGGTGTLKEPSKNIQSDLQTCAFEAYARALAETCSDYEIEFDEVETDKADSNIVDTVCDYINKGLVVNNEWIELQSGYTINGNKRKVSAKWNILFKNGSVTLRDDVTGETFVYSVSNNDIYDIVEQYFVALDKLQKSALKNVLKEFYGDFSKLIDWDFVKEWKGLKDEKYKEYANDIANLMSKHGIDHFTDIVCSVYNYHKQAKNIIDELKDAKTVFTSDTATLDEKVASLTQLKDIKVTSYNCGNYADKAYDKMVDAEDKYNEYLKEYLTTGTIEDLEPDNIWDNIKNAFTKNTVKCPVNVTVLDASGNTVGYVGDDDIWYDNSIIIEEDGETKIIYTPIGKQFRLIITGTDIGKVSYTSEQFIDGTSTGSRINCCDIPIVEGTEINVVTPADKITSADDVSINREGEKCEAVLLNNVSSKVNISVQNDASCGTITGSGDYVIGDAVTLNVNVNDGYVFEGWYNGDTLLSYSKTYQFMAKTDLALTAKYQKKATAEELKQVVEEIVNYLRSLNPVNNVISAENIIKTYSAKAQTFSIGAVSKEGTALTYASNNNNIAVDAATGVVTVKAKYIGSAVITISSAEKDNVKATTTAITVTVNPTKTTLSSASNVKGKKIKLKWKKNTVGTGYQIQYSTSSKFASGNKTATVKKNKKVTGTISKLKKGKIYYVRIRTYKKVDGQNYFSAWSNVKKVKIKK